MHLPRKKPETEPVGWAWFEQTNRELEAQREQAKQTADELTIAYAACFQTPAGQVVLADLRRFLARVAAWDPNGDFYRAAAQGFYREGQNSMVAYIDAMTERGKRT